MSNATGTLNTAFMHYAELCAQGGEPSPRLRVLARSPQSALVSLVVDYGMDRLPPGTRVELIFTDLRPQARLDAVAAALPGPAALRHAKARKFVRCHEQLTLGDAAYLCAPVIGETTDDPELLNLWATYEGADVAVANFAFEMVWGAAVVTRPQGGQAGGQADAAATGPATAGIGRFKRWFGGAASRTMSELEQYLRDIRSPPASWQAH
jgi:hypothetical protein